MSRHGDHYGGRTAGQALTTCVWRPALRSLRAALHGLTVQGRSIIAAGLVVGAFSPLLGEKGLFRIAMLLVVLPLLAALAVSATRVPVWCERSLSPQRVHAQQPAQVRLRLSARLSSVQLRLEDPVPAELMTSTTLTANTTGPAPGPSDPEILGPRFRLPSLPAGSTAELGYQIIPVRRGHYVLGPLTVQCGDPFGMCTLLQPVSPAQTLIVTPPVTPLPLNPLLDGRTGLGEHRGQTLGAYGDDAATVRAYRPGDDPRRVHWRSTARAGELMVRQQEQPHHAKATVLLDTREAAYRFPIADPGEAPHTADALHAGFRHTDASDDSFEWAIAATASIVVHLIDQGLRVRLLTDTGGQVTSGESEGTDQSTLEASREIMDFLADVACSDRRDLRGGFRAGAAGGAPVARGWDGDPGVVVGVVGALSADDTEWLSQSRGGLNGRAECTVALIVDGPSWEPSDLGNWLPGMTLPSTAQAVDPVSTIPGWRAVHAARGSDIARLWYSLGSQASESATPAPRGTDGWRRS